MLILKSCESWLILCNQANPVIMKIMVQTDNIKLGRRGEPLRPVLAPVRA